MHTNSREEKITLEKWISFFHCAGYNKNKTYHSVVSNAPFPLLQQQAQSQTQINSYADEFMLPLQTISRRLYEREEILVVFYYVPLQNSAVKHVYHTIHTQKYPQTVFLLI